MAAPTKFCRLKLHADLQDLSCSAKTIWISVDFDKTPNIKALHLYLADKLKLPYKDINLFLHDVLIPTWETCAFIFRDNEDIVLKLNTKDPEAHNRPECTANNSQKQSITDFCVEERTIKKQAKPSKALKRKIDTITSEETNKNDAFRVETEGDGQNKNCENSSRKEEYEESNKAPYESESDDESMTVTKRDRSKTFTPAELALIEEMKNLPKPKRIRKHRRKNKQVDVAVTQESDREKVSTVQLNCSYQGNKIVFDSDDENERVKAKQFEDLYDDSQGRKHSHSHSTAGNREQDHSTAANTPINDSVSYVEVKPFNGVTENSTPLPSGDQQDDIIELKTPEYNKSKYKKKTQNQSPGCGNSPVVFKRQKLKLRATISPAIYQELERESMNDDQTVSSFHLLHASTSHTSTSEFEGKQKSKIKWHNSQTSSPLEKSRVSQLNDVQSNTSQIYQCQPKSSVPVRVRPREDYTVYSNLHGPPRIGDRLAFKRLEVSEDYTPAISDYKEGVVLAYEPQSKLVHIKLSEQNKEIKRRNGVFDVHIEGEDGTLTNVSQTEEQIVDNLDSFYDIKLIPAGETGG